MDADNEDKENATNLSIETVDTVDKSAQQLWNVIKIATTLIFNSVYIGNRIYNTFKQNKWNKIDYVLNNLIQFETNNIINLTANSVKNNDKIQVKWDDNRDNKILYQLLLAIYKDKKTNILDLLNEFIAILPFQSATTKFYDCNTLQIICILTNQTFNILSNDIDSIFHNDIIQHIVENEIDGHKLQNIKPENLVLNVNDNLLLQETLLKVYKHILSYKDHEILKCKICYYLNNIPKQSSITTCTGCNSIIRKMPSDSVADLDDEKVNRYDLGDIIIKFFNDRREKEFDKQVFGELFTLFKSNEKKK
eukprot:383147_1